VDIAVELWTAQPDGLLDGGKDEERGQRGVVADALLQSGADGGGREAGVEAAAKERARAGRSGGVAYQGWVLSRREGVPAVRSVVKRCAGGIVSSGMEGSDRDAGVGGELAEDVTMPGRRSLSSGAPEVSKNNITPRF
jgi:hypothetical protein